MARRELKPWHYQVTTALASVTLLVVIAFFAQTFNGFFLTEEDPVLVAIERIKQKKSDEAAGAAPAAPQTEEEAQTAKAAEDAGEAARK